MSKTFAEAKPSRQVGTQIAKPVLKMTNPVALRQLMANARQRGREDVWREAFYRLCVLQGMDQKDPLHRDFYQALAAYEQLLTEKNGRTTRANRTPQKLKNKGVLQCLEDWVVGPPTMGFSLLVEYGMPELTGEYLVLKYGDRFSARAVAAAKSRLQMAGVSPPSRSG